jgi:CheY-like chemotaxis protein
MIYTELGTSSTPTAHQLCLGLCGARSANYSREKWILKSAVKQNGQQAIETARHLHPDLIVTDLSMPVMDGLEETRILRNLLPGVPIIIYTSHVGPSVEQEAYSAGAAAFISKSDAAITLIRTARGLLDRLVA